WQKVPPPLYLEGTKVQTPWLYSFLKDPMRLRHTTVLRMPKFNMSDAEAQGLANYFAAVDKVPYPYQDIPQRNPSYLAMRTRQLERMESAPDEPYLVQSWHVLNNAGLCIKCHSVGGRDVQISNPQTDIR